MLMNSPIIGRLRISSTTLPTYMLAIEAPEQLGLF